MENLFSGKWADIKGEVLKAWTTISNEELDQTGGRLHDVVSLLQDKFGLAREEAATRLMELAAVIEGDQTKAASMDASATGSATGSMTGSVSAKQEPTKH